MEPTGITHVTTELAPYRVLGGLGIGLQRLVSQLADAGIRSRVLMETAEPGIEPRVEPWGELAPLRVTGSRYEQLAGLVEQALHELERASSHDHALVAHDNECAAVLVHARRRGTRSLLVYWLHSLSDRGSERLAPRLREGLPPGSMSASAIDVADLVVTSEGVLADAEELEWPAPMRALQGALLRARARGAVLCVGPSQSLDPIEPAPAPAATPSARRSIVFPARPNVNKGVGFFMTIAERLAHLDVDFIVTGDPCSPADMARPGARRIRWLGWRPQAELFAVLSRASCVVIPSLSEGFGMGAAEAARLGVRLLHHDIGGLRSLPSSPTTTALGSSAADRAALYRIWADLFECEWDEQWIRWDRARPSFAALEACWIEAVDKVLREDPRTRPAPQRAPFAPSWGEALAQWLRARDTSTRA